jgi:copper chaperone CopZ
MCEKRIEKAAFSVKGVKSADWHIDHKDIHLIIDENKCSVEDVAKAIAAVGHDTEFIKAKDEDYEKLHGCCLYNRL